METTTFPRRISYIGTDTSYVAHRAEDCRDATDLSAYEESLRLSDTVLMGCVCVEVLRLPKN